MNLFEFLLVIVSLVLGLGITELLGGLTRILRGELTLGRLHAIWMLIVLQLQIQMAWAFWNLHLREAWSYPEFLLLLAGPLLLYLSASVLFPATGTDQPLDDHLMSRRRPFFVLMSAFMAYSVLFTWLLMGRDFPLVTTSVRALVLAAFIILACTTRRSVHLMIALAILALHVWYTYSYSFMVVATPQKLT
jgi:hypothetical protein